MRITNSILPNQFSSVKVFINEIDGILLSGVSPSLIIFIVSRQLEENMPEDYYQTLGVSRSDSTEDIRKGFRQKAMEYHPDRNKTEGASDKFKEINEAYQVLSDPKKKAQYDQFGHAGVNGNRSGGSPFDGFDGFGGFGDIFDSFFGGSSRRNANQPTQGQDIYVSLELDFEESVFGVDKTISINRLEVCDTCDGSRAKNGSTPLICSTCNGQGQVRRSQKSVFGQFTQVVGCSACQATGKIIDDPCTDCKGNGIVNITRNTTIEIPQGIENGMQVRMTGWGNHGTNGGPSGNLYVETLVSTHKTFTRRKFDLIYQLPLNIAEASIGASVIVPTLEDDGHILKIPAGTQFGDVLTIKGKGVPHLRGNGRGDIKVITNVNVPKKLSKYQKELLAKLSQSLNGTADTSETAYDHGSVDSDFEDDKGLINKIKDILT